MGKLEGKVAVITAATSGMALATAKLFVEEGAYVFITGRRKEKLDEAVKLIGKNVTGVQGDAANLADLDRLYETVKREKGKIDILFASAGQGELATLEQVTEEHFDKTFDLNVRGTLFTVQKALPLFNDNGSIFLNGSIASIKGFPAFGVYSASKAAVRSFARTWLVELEGAKNSREHSQPRHHRHADPRPARPRGEGALQSPHSTRRDGPSGRDRNRSSLPRLERLELRQRRRTLRRRRYGPDLTTELPSEYNLVGHTEVIQQGHLRKSGQIGVSTEPQFPQCDL